MLLRALRNKNLGNGRRVEKIIESRSSSEDDGIIETAEEPHLHFAMKKGDKWINPADVIKNLK